MFLPSFLWFSLFHFQDLLNEYLYLMPGGLLLLPIAIYAAIKKFNAQILFWGCLLLGYFVYTFCWNPDRGYPEDWDLFSPLAAIALPFFLHIFLSNNGEETEETERLKETMYLVCMGFLPFTLAQIWFHHTQRFL